MDFVELFDWNRRRVRIINYIIEIYNNNNSNVNAISKEQKRNAADLFDPSVMLSVCLVYMYT